MRNNEDQSTLKRLSDNFISLVVLQLINYLLPLLLIPYLIRVLGIDGFGIYSFVLAIMMYGVKMSDYGFELSATYHISLNKENKLKKDEIFSSVLMIKLFIVIAYLLLLTPLIFLVDKLYIYRELLFLSFGVLIGHFMFPVWFFQGMEKMRYIMLLNSFLKFFFIASVFIFVKESSDLYLLLLLNSIAIIITGFMALYVAIKHFDIKLSWQPWDRVYFYLKDGWYIFTSKIAVEFYTTVNIIILGLFVSPLMVGYYAIAEKIIHAIGGLLDPLTRTVYPYLVNLYQSSSDNFIVRNRQLSLVIFIIMFPVSLLVMFFAEQILSIITGREVADLSIQSLEILSLALMVYLYGSQFTNILVTIKETKFLNKILFLSALINTLLAPFLIYYYGVLGLAWLNVFIVFFMMLNKGYYIFIYLKK